MSIAEKLQTIAENEQKVFDAGKETGKKAQNNNFWDFYLRYRNSNCNELFAGAGWNKNSLKPTKDIRPTSATNMFRDANAYEGFASGAYDLAEHFERLGVALDFSKCTQFAGCFNYACFTRIGVVDCSSASGNALGSMFAYAKIRVVDKLILNENISYASTFANSSSFQHMIVEGVIGKNGFNMQWAVNLDHESLMSIINALKDYSADTSSTVWRVTIGAENRAKLTDAEIQIAENKGWIVE